MKAIGNKANSYIQIFDIDREQGLEQRLDLKLIESLESCGQLMLGKALYLCGTTSKLNTDCSFFFKFDPETTPQFNILINTKESHYKPAMTNLFKESIIVIGGKNTVKCEKYLIKLAKWRPLPDLPET